MMLSCDTFVVLSDKTEDKTIIFGKNSDRPKGEVQDIVYYPRNKCQGRQKCTYIEVDSVPETYSVILSKPAWMWGAEMGSNEHGLCIGNEAVWGKIAPSTEKRLLGMDIVRLALERSKNASEAIDIISGLLDKYGQGGPCSSTMDDFVYHNSFMLVDKTEAWVMETVDNHWAAERISAGFRNISNCLSIQTKIDRESSGLRQTAIDKGLWNGEGEFNFMKIYSDSDKNHYDRYEAGKELLNQKTKDSKFNIKSMIEILRDEDSGICRDCSAGFPTASSQVSALYPNKKSDVHFFTGTPDPSVSYFKPFIFHPLVKEASAKTISNTQEADLKHYLYGRHEEFYDTLKKDTELQKTLRNIENVCIDELFELFQNSDPSIDSGNDDIHALFADSVESEIRFYR